MCVAIEITFIIITKKLNTFNDRAWTEYLRATHNNTAAKIYNKINHLNNYNILQSG